MHGIGPGFLAERDAVFAELRAEAQRLRDCGATFPCEDCVSCLKKRVTELREIVRDSGDLAQERDEVADGS